MIDADRLAEWMDSAGLPGRPEPVEQRVISSGSQNEIYEIRRGELHAALRIPPPSAPENRDEGIMREWRIIEALDGTDVPHTAAVASCPDRSVLGRPFYLMGFVEGIVEHYAKISGRQVDDVDYYVVLARWKKGVVLEQGYQRAGESSTLQAFGPIAAQLVQEAAELAESTDYR